MLIKQSRLITRLNIILAILVFVMSILSIVWHNESRQLYIAEQKAQKHSQNTMALHKQLSTEHAAQFSGSTIQQNAKSVLKMKQPKQKNKRQWKEIVL